MGWYNELPHSTAMSFTFSANAGLRINSKIKSSLIFVPVGFSHTDDFVPVEGGKNGGYGRFGDLISARRLRRLPRLGPAHCREHCHQKKQHGAALANESAQFPAFRPL